MKRTLLHVLGVVAVMVFAGAVFFIACSSSSTNTSRQAAEGGLTTQKGMAGEDDDYSFFGYESASDVGSEELGDPLEVRTLDVAALLANDTASDSMILATAEYLFPVTVRGTIIESIRVMDIEGDWEYISSESKGEIEKALELISANSLNQDSCYILEVDEIGLAFVGYESDGHVMLIPLYTTTSPELTSGTKYVFTAIAPALKTEVQTSKGEKNDLKPPSSISLTPSEVIEAAFATEIKASGKTSKLLGVTLAGQEQDNWCWAASGRMTMLYAGGDSTTITQCAQANLAFSQSTCCTNGATTACNKPYYPEYNKWGFSFTYTDDTAPTWKALKGLMDSGKPLVFLWMWNEGGGHAMVAVGYYEDTTTNTKMVNMIDPWPPNVGKKSSITYASFVGGTGYNYTFGGYYTNVTKN